MEKTEQVIPVAADPESLYGRVTVKKEAMVIPTYQVHEADKNPVFFETRNNQGTKGNVYPIPFTDRLSDVKTDKTYEVVKLENEFLEILALPEIGGRIYAGLDKTNQYNFIYRNHVIKPALIGLCGPWISGGIEFNWPQHHRPTTFMPTDSLLDENEDGSKTLWMGETEPLNRTKGMVGVTLYPGKSYIQAKVRLYNRTPHVQTFHWWANLAVHVNDSYRAVFPPDIDYVTFHAKTQVTPFPIVKGMFAGVDYGEGTDITWYKNVPAPHSFFIFNSNFNFMGGYDFSQNAGVIHVADRHVSVGKKIFNWGAEEFGKRWCQNLSDNDGPYIEIMTGGFTDNQPDFSWLQPFETKTFEQYWYPLRDIGMVKNANLEGAVSLEVDGNTVRLAFNTTSERQGAVIVLKAMDSVIFEKQIDISPAKPFKTDIEMPEEYEEDKLHVALYAADGSEIISYRKPPMYFEDKEMPKAIPPALPPQDIKFNEELYLNGLHIEQYRHPTFEPEPYYEEALRRDPGDSRCNNRLGLLYMKRGMFEKAEVYFRRAVETLTRRNPNPYDGEAYYNLGLVLKYMFRYDEACDMLMKSTWNYAWQAPGYYASAEIMCLKGNFNKALEYLDKGLKVNMDNLRARNLKAAVLRKLEKPEEAMEICRKTIDIDKLDFHSRYERYLLLELSGDRNGAEEALSKLKTLLRKQGEAYIDIAIEYGSAGFYDEALSILQTAVKDSTDSNAVYPMLYYYLGFYSGRKGEGSEALGFYKLAAAAPSDYCFPDRLDSIAVLEEAMKLNPKDAKAPYYLGNMLYNRHRCDEAIKHWEISREIDDSFSIVHRNLGLAYFDKKQNVPAARAAMEKAFELDPYDSRHLFELMQLYKNINIAPEIRLEWMEKYAGLVQERDDMYLSEIMLYIQTGKYDAAIQLLKSRNFHPYEGGEGVLPAQHVTAYLLRGREYLKSGKVSEALMDFETALVYPENYGEGKRYGVREAHVFYHIALANEAAGKTEKARYWYEKSAAEKGMPSDVDYFRGLALEKLGRTEEAKTVFQDLIEYAGKELDKGDRFEYFGHSPAALPFEHDREKQCKVRNGCLLGLGYLGLGQNEAAAHEFRKVLELDINQVWPRILLEQHVMLLP